MFCGVVICIYVFKAEGWLIGSGYSFGLTTYTVPTDKLDALGRVTEIIFKQHPVRNLLNPEDPLRPSVAASAGKIRDSSAGVIFLLLGGLITNVLTLVYALSWICSRRLAASLWPKRQLKLTGWGCAISSFWYILAFIVYVVGVSPAPQGLAIGFCWLDTLVAFIVLLVALFYLVVSEYARDWQIRYYLEVIIGVLMIVAFVFAIAALSFKGWISGGGRSFGLIHCDGGAPCINGNIDDSANDSLKKASSAALILGILGLLSWFVSLPFVGSWLFGRKTYFSSFIFASLLTAASYFFFGLSVLAYWGTYTSPPEGSSYGFSLALMFFAGIFMFIVWGVLLVSYFIPDLMDYVREKGRGVKEKYVVRWRQEANRAVDAHDRYEQRASEKRHVAASKARRADAGAGDQIEMQRIGGEDIPALET